MRLRNATYMPEFASFPEIYSLVDEVLPLLRESGRRVATRVHVLIRLKTREDIFVPFRRARLRRCFQFYENGRS